MKEIIGICRRCKEWTDVNDSCCGEPVYFEGDLVSAEDAEEMEADEFKEARDHHLEKIEDAIRKGEEVR